MNVFTYGSLMFDDVWQGVVGRVAPAVAASLRDHQVRKISGQTFPGMVPAPGQTAEGRSWLDVTPEELEKLDTFESGIYDRELVSVLASDGRTIECWAYIVRPDCRGLLLDVPWDREEFRRRHLATFLG